MCAVPMSDDERLEERARLVVEMLMRAAQEVQEAISTLKGLHEGKEEDDRPI
jgi:hypothetical protein